MLQLIKIAIIGFTVSFLGSLPLGTLNITALKIVVSRNVNQALLFSIAAILIELIVVRITLIKTSKLNLNTKISNYILPIAIIFLCYLSVTNFVSVSSDSELGVQSKIPFIESSFMLGLLLSISNPMHIPFWLGWNSILIKQNKLKQDKNNYIFYISGIAIGSFAGLLVFIFLGKHLIQSIKHYNSLMSILMGIFYLGFALFLSIKLYKNQMSIIQNRTI